MVAKTKGILLALAIATASILIVACGAQQQPQQQPAAAPKAAEATKPAAVEPTKAPAVKPVADLEIVPVAANPADPNVIETTLSDGKTKIQMGATGLENVSVGAPVTLKGSATDPKTKLTKYSWTLTAPSSSKAALDAKDKAQVKFTPDVSGIYKLDLVVENEAGASPMASVQIHAGEYIGVEKGNCVQCHAKEVKEWSETGHAIIFTREIKGGADPKTSHYGEACIRCHTTGYYAGVKNGGFADVQAQTGWKFPALDAIQKGDGATWDAVPAELKAKANIQCEACHGPAKDHVEKGAKMDSSLDEGVCNVCHNGGGHHIKGAEYANSAHSEGDAQAFTYPVGPSRQDCVRCHSGSGYTTFIQNPTEKASWDNSQQKVTCAVCHDPHSDANKDQLRITGKPVQVPDVDKDFGLSATCVECHNARTTAADATKASFPHYSAAAEMLSNAGGVSYGQQLTDSPHGMVVGAAPIKDPSDKTGQAMLFGGNTPGSCVACHMYPTPADAKDARQYKVGDHSFNMTTPDGKGLNTEACQSCHAGATSFDMTAKADYDGNGKAEGVQEEVSGLLTVLQKAVADAGVKPVKGHPYFDQADVAKANDKVKNAIYNYLFVRGTEENNGKANAIHNFKRSVELLQLSYKDLTGKDVPNATVMK